MSHRVRSFKKVGLCLLAGLLSLGTLSTNAFAASSSAPWPAPPPTKAAALSAATTAPMTIAVSAPAAPTDVYLKGPGPNWLGLAMSSVPATATTIRLVATPWGPGVSGLATQQAVAPAYLLEVYVRGLQYSTTYRLTLSSCDASGLCSLVPDVLIAVTADWAPPSGLRATSVTMSKIQVAWDAPDPSCDIAGNCWAGSLPYSVRWTGLGGGWHTLSASGGYICPWGAPCPGYALQTTGLTTQISGLAPDAPFWIEVSECATTGSVIQCGRWSDPLKVVTLPIPVFAPAFP
jgi:hypothetical protein